MMERCHREAIAAPALRNIHAFPFPFWCSLPLIPPPSRTGGPRLMTEYTNSSKRHSASSHDGEAFRLLPEHPTPVGFPRPHGDRVFIGRQPVGFRD